MALTNKILLIVSLFSVIMLVYQTWIKLPELSEYAEDAYLFQEPSEGYQWKDWVLEARDMYWKTLIGLVVQACFFVSFSIWGVAKTISSRTKPKLETNSNIS